MGIDFHSFCDWSSLHQKGGNMACLLYSTDICRHPILDLLYIYFDIPYFCGAYLCVVLLIARSNVVYTRRHTCLTVVARWIFDQLAGNAQLSFDWKSRAIIVTAFCSLHSLNRQAPVLERHSFADFVFWNTHLDGTHISTRPTTCYLQRNSLQSSWLPFTCYWHKSTMEMKAIQCQLIVWNLQTYFVPAMM